MPEGSTPWSSARRTARTRRWSSQHSTQASTSSSRSRCASRSRTPTRSTRRQEAEQVEQAVGSDAPDVVRAFSESFLGSLLHDLNVVHGALEKLGEPLPPTVVAGDWWNEGRAVYGALRLESGARVDAAW